MKGMTLIEVLIASIITLVLFLALMQTALVSIDSNMTNVLRDEAVSIAEAKMSEMRNTAKLTAGTTTETVTRNLRNITDFEYTVTTTIGDVGSDNMQITITVGWNWKENPYAHEISSIVRR